MTETIHESSDYTGLSHFITNLSKRNKDPTTLTKDQSQRLKDLLSPLVSRLLQSIDSNEIVEQGQKNLRFILNAMSLYLKQNLEPELESQVSNLKNQISSMKTAALDDQQDVIINAENALIGRIVDKLDTQQQISTEDELTDYVITEASKYDKLISDLISKFDLPKTTKKTQIIPQLESKFSKQPPKQKGVTFVNKVTDSELNETFRQELLKTTDELLSVRNELDTLKKTVDSKNDHIRRLREERNLAKQQLKDALTALEEKEKEQEVLNQVKDQQNQNPQKEKENNSDSLISAQIESIKAELLTAQIENEKKSRKLEKKRNYIKKYEEKMAKDEEIINGLQYENKKLSEKIEKFNDINQAKNLKHQIENNNFSDENAELKKKLDMKNQEIQKLQNLFDELTLQFDQQNIELADISAGRIELVTYVQRLNEACKLLETHLEFSNNRVRDLTNSLEESLTKNEELERKQQQQLQQNQLQQNEQGSVHQALDLTFLDSIRQLSEETLPSSAKQINDISNDEEVSVPQRILQLFSFVVETLNKKTQSNFFTDNDNNTNRIQNSRNDNSDLLNMRNLASRFYRAALSELKFIQELANSRNIQAWVIGRDDEEVRFQLQTQCARLESFIAENCDQIQNDRLQPNLFDYLLISSNHNPSTLSANIADFIDRFKEPKTSEGKQLYLMLVQALTANDVLQRYALEARNQCDLQTKEIRQLRNLNQIAEREINYDDNNSSGNVTNTEYEIDDIDDDNINDDKRRRKNKKNRLSKGSSAAIEKVRSTIRSAILNEKGLQELLTMLKCIDILDEECFDSNKYTRKIEKRLSQEISDSQETKNKLNSIVNEANNQLTVLKEEMNKLNGDFQKKQKDLQKEIADKDSKINDLSQKLDISNSQYENLVRENEKNSTLIVEENNQINAEMQKQIEETKKQYDEIVNDLKNEVNEMQRRVDQSQNDAKEKIIGIKSSSKKKQAKLVTALRNIQTKLEKSESERFTKIAELTKELENSQKSEEEAKSEVRKLTDEVNDLKSKISTLTVEQKMMNSRLASKDEKMKREKALFDSQLKLRLFAAESDSKAKLETMKNELNLKTQEFMTRICRTFKEMVYVNQPVNEATVEQILSKVRARLTMLEKDSFAAEEANHELQIIRQQLELYQSEGSPIKEGQNQPKFIKVSSCVGEIIEKKKQLESEVTSLEQQVKSFKKDVVDARAVLMQNTNNKEWEDWARKVYTLISGGFNLVRSPKEIRNVIEEAIFAAIGNKIIWRRLDCLRAEKKLIIRGALRVKSKKGAPPSLTQLITIPIVVGRLQKMSGHFQSSLSLNREGVGQQANQANQQMILNQQQQTQQKQLKQFPLNNNIGNKKDQQKGFTNGPTSRAPLFSKFIVESPGITNE
ncbi:hypothetical protein M9Y10_022993 [Tritrichomonas musculus]|uniref:Viral A-type inclusion protein n=1 Tax=Tritrichomonas musculus TaxID=1915356 RepID=A0ABR2KUQ7_9EUKA